MEQRQGPAASSQPGPRCEGFRGGAARARAAGGKQEGVPGRGAVQAPALRRSRPAWLAAVPSALPHRPTGSGQGGSPPDSLARLGGRPRGPPLEAPHSRGGFFVLRLGHGTGTSSRKRSGWFAGPRHTAARQPRSISAGRFGPL